MIDAYFVEKNKEMDYKRAFSVKINKNRDYDWIVLRVHIKQGLVDF